MQAVATCSLDVESLRVEYMPRFTGAKRIVEKPIAAGLRGRALMSSFRSQQQPGHRPERRGAGRRRAAGDRPAGRRAGDGSRRCRCIRGLRSNRRGAANVPRRLRQPASAGRPESGRRPWPTLQGGRRSGKRGHHRSGGLGHRSCRSRDASGSGRRRGGRTADPRRRGSPCARGARSFCATPAHGGHGFPQRSGPTDPQRCAAPANEFPCSANAPRGRGRVSPRTGVHRHRSSPARGVVHARGELGPQAHGRAH